MFLAEPPTVAGRLLERQTTADTDFQVSLDASDALTRELDAIQEAMKLARMREETSGGESLGT